MTLIRCSESLQYPVTEPCDGALCRYPVTVPAWQCPVTIPPRQSPAPVPPARELLSCPVSQPHSSHAAQFHISLPTHFPSHSPQALSVPFSFPHPPSQILATFLSTACVLKRFLLTSPRKLALTCVKWGFLRTSGWNSLGGLGEAVMMHCLFLPKIGIFGHQNAGVV